MPRKTRRVDYRRIDRGARLRRNADIVAENQARAYARAEHRERQAVRLRQRESRSLKAAKQIEARLGAMPSPRGGLFGLGGGRARDAAQERQRLEAQRQRALRHARLTRQLLRDIEKILANLMHVRGLHQSRHRALVTLAPSRGRGRGRGRAWWTEGLG